ncbi:hypothetical protein VTL71DRAFT_3444 [Oculimacula yallundae]|uniref:Uncharacterized protein n=1 Tax=Oculimacula yallundae TaxID=86028 RepID=A0ABR4C7A1_9HELO
MRDLLISGISRDLGDKVASLAKSYLENSNNLDDTEQTLERGKIDEHRKVDERRKTQQSQRKITIQKLLEKEEKEEKKETASFSKTSIKQSLGKNPFVIGSHISSSPLQTETLSTNLILPLAVQENRHLSQPGVSTQAQKNTTSNIGIPWIPRDVLLAHRTWWTDTLELDFKPLDRDAEVSGDAVSKSPQLSRGLEVTMPYFQSPTQIHLEDGVAVPSYILQDY